MTYYNDLTKYSICNKTPAQAFTPPADKKKMGTNWTFVYYGSASMIETLWHFNEFKEFSKYFVTVLFACIIYDCVHMTKKL